MADSQTPVNPQPSPLPVANYWVNFFNNIIDQYMKLGEQAAETLAITQQPWLGWPIIKSIFFAVVNYVGGKLEGAQQRAVDAIIIDIQKNGEQSVVVQSTAALMKAQKAGDIDAIEKAKKSAAAAYDNALRNSGWATNIHS